LRRRGAPPVMIANATATTSFITTDSFVIA
jgi:hypothetical protein